MAAQSFHHYEVLKTDDGRAFELGRGAMGVTYKAFDTKLRCLVALKVISPAMVESQTARERFIREARAAARLRHPNVASVIYLSCDEEPWFYAMEFIEGETVAALVKRRGPLDIALALRIASQVCEALAAAHREGIVHRDIKPSNLMLCHHGDEILLKVIDFGLAKSLAADAETTLTQGVVGTPLFASPEQLDGRDVDVRSDIYSLGVTLWYLLGRAPFAGSVGQIISQHLYRPPPLEELEGVPHYVVSLLETMLQKEPALRPQTPAELRIAIQRCLHEVEHTPSLGKAVSASATEVFRGCRKRTADNESQLVTGTVLSNRFELIAELRRDVASTLFSGLDRVTGQMVAVRALNTALFASEAHRERFKAEVEKARSYGHPNLVRIVAFENAGERDFMVLEWLNAFSLRAVLRARRELQLVEALPFIEQAAAALDHAAANDLTRLSMDLHDILIHFPEPLAEGRRESLLSERIEQWPTFILKITPCALALTPGEVITRADVTHPEFILMPKCGDVSGKYLHLLARMAYDILGGSRQPDLRHYLPLASLTEAGNDMMSRCLAAAHPPPFANAQQFFEALRTEARDLPRRPRPLVSREVPRAVPARGFPWARALAGAATLAALAAASSFLFTRNSPSHGAKPATGVPVAQAPAGDEKMSEKLPKLTSELTTDAKRESVETAAVHPTPAFSQTAPQRVEPINAEGVAALRQAAINGDGDAVLQLASFLQNSGTPGADEEAVRILEKSTDARALNQLGLCYARGEGTPRDVTKARELFEKAHQAGNLDGLNNLAVIFMDVDANPAVARKLLQRGAEAGNPNCMDSYARCLWEGAGGLRNQEDARMWFRRAAELGHAGAQEWLRDHR